uniref:Uncharacterized protein n=1 Tax=Buteo japonicus TaxID=224669 RepID=A0A8C0AND3_9AVES
MVYCSALNCQNATSGVYKNSTVTFYGFPLHNKPLLKEKICLLEMRSPFML